MDTTFTVENYGPIKKASGTLTPLHAFIGPNDSGKSSLLRALISGIDVAQNRAPKYATGEASVVRFESPSAHLFAYLIDHSTQADFNGSTVTASTAVRALGLEGAPRLARFEPDRLRSMSSLVTEEQRLDFIENRGAGLPGVYDMLLNRNDNTFQEISDELRRLFPNVLRLRLKTINASAKSLAIDLTDGKVVDASMMSEGMLFYLAYAAMRRVAGLSLLAVEEPETGLHPARIVEVMRILREISKSGTKVLIATHNPLVINELQPGEVSVVTRKKDEGTQVRPISQTPNFDKRSKVYALGELWLSYANGRDEAPLFEEKAGEKTPA